MPIEYKNSFQLKAYNFKYNQKKHQTFPIKAFKVSDENI